MRRSTAALVLTCLVFTIGVSAPIGTAAAASERVVAQIDGADRLSPEKRYQRQARRATNNRRADHGLGELRKTDCLQRFAVKQAKAMANQEELFHQLLPPILNTCGLELVAENVAYGFATGRAVVNDGWMESPGHRANILRAGYKAMGIGARRSSDGVWYVAQVFGRSA